VTKHSNVRVYGIKRQHVASLALYRAAPCSLECVMLWYVVRPPLHIRSSMMLMYLLLCIECK